MKLSQTIAASCAKDMAGRDSRHRMRISLIRARHKALQLADIIRETSLDLDDEDDLDEGFATEDGEEP